MTPAEPDVFAVLADPTRRRILVLLAFEEMSVSALASRFPVTRPAISQHLGVLRESGLVTGRREGRNRLYRTCPAPLARVVDWLSYFDAFWDERLAALGRYLEDTVDVDPEQGDGRG